MSIENLLATHAITQVVYRCARALDRLDRELLLTCFHADATDEHAPFYQGSASGFIDWVLPALGGMLATRHDISNVMVTPRGDEAGVEAYWSARLLVRPGEAIRRGGRYLDRFACIGGVWAIVHRQSITEWSSHETAHDELALAAIPRAEQGIAMARGTRDRTDPSYAILNLTETP